MPDWDQKPVGPSCGNLYCGEPTDLRDPNLAPSEALPEQIIWVRISSYFAKKVSKTTYWFILIDSEVQHNLIVISRTATR